MIRYDTIPNPLYKPRCKQHRFRRCRLRRIRPEMAHFVLLLCSAWPAHPSHWSPPAHGSATVGADDRRHTHTEHAGQLLADCRRALEAWWSCANETLTLSKKDAARFQARLAHCAPRSQRPVRNSSAFVSWLPSMMKAVDANLLQQPPLPPRFVVLGGPACAAAFPPAPADPRPSTRKNKTGGGRGERKDQRDLRPAESGAGGPAMRPRRRLPRRISCGTQRDDAAFIHSQLRRGARRCVGRERRAVAGGGPDLCR